MRPAREIVRESALLWSMSSAFLGAFGVIALLLAALGIYGVIAFSVAQRRSELGLRMALGADGRTLRRSVIGDGLRLTGLGLAVGLVLAVALAGLARNVLFGVSVLDPITVGGVLALFAGVALVASAVPAWRAARVDPLRALREE
ncbi:MAG: FtsX-like permease family protein [Gemmatimonadota bacterium]